MAKKPRKMLGSADSPYILSLMALIQTQSRKTIATWCMDYAETHILPIYEKYRPGDERPRHALLAARDWLQGLVKLPYVKNIILNEAHTAARENEDFPVVQAAARAVGQAASSIHTPTHSLGVAFYGAAAIAYDRAGVEASPETYDRIAEEVCADMEAALREATVENEPNPAKINWYC